MSYQGSPDPALYWERSPEGREYDPVDDSQEPLPRVICEFCAAVIFQGRDNFTRLGMCDNCYRESRGQARTRLPRMVCAWCGLIMRDGPENYVSHGMCDSCFRSSMG